MKKSSCWRIGLQAIGTWIILTAFAHAQEGQPTPESTPTTWDSPKMREIKRQWQLLRDAYSKTPEKFRGKGGKDKFAELGGMQYRLLRKRLSDEDVRQLVASAGTLPVGEKDWGEFNWHVIAFMVDALIHSRDRENLAQLFATRFPSTLDVWRDWCIEYELVREVMWGDPILILGDAYAKCQVPEVRGDIAAAIRRAFAGEGIEGKDDDAFVKNALEWYKKEKDHLTFRIHYLQSVEWDNRSVIDKPGYGLFEKTTNSPGASNDKPEAKGTKPTFSRKIVNWMPTQYVSGPEVEKELAKLTGTWEVVECMSNGERIPEERYWVWAERYIFDGDRLKEIDPTFKHEYEYRVRLGPHQTPRQMDLIKTDKEPGPPAEPPSTEIDRLINELKDDTTLAIYEWQGDLLRLSFANHGPWTRPISVHPEEDSYGSLYILRRVKE